MNPEERKSLLAGNRFIHLGVNPDDPPKVHVDSVQAILELRDKSALLYLGHARVLSPLAAREVADLFSQMQEAPQIIDLSQVVGFPVWVRHRGIAALERKEVVLVDGTRISYRDANPGPCDA